MNQPHCKYAILLFALAVSLAAGPIWAADSKGKLPKAKAGDPAAKAVPKEPAKEQAQEAKGSDRFIDKDNNGVDDRHETRVIRSEAQEAAKPPVKKQEVPPPTAAPEPPPKAPPGL